MVKRLWPVLIALLACGLIAAGCGDDDDESSSDDSAATTEEATTEDATTEDSGAATDTGNADVDAAVQSAIDACKQSVGAAPGLSADTVSDLEGLCEEAASGDVEDAQAASVEVCKAIAEDTVPEGSARDSAVSACESAVQ